VATVPSRAPPRHRLAGEPMSWAHTSNSLMYSTTYLYSRTTPVDDACVACPWLHRVHDVLGTRRTYVSICRIRDIQLLLFLFTLLLLLPLKPWEGAGAKILVQVMPRVKHSSRPVPSVVSRQHRVYVGRKRNVVLCNCYYPKRLECTNQPRLLFHPGPTWHGRRAYEPYGPRLPVIHVCNLLLCSRMM